MVLEEVLVVMDLEEVLDPLEARVMDLEEVLDPLEARVMVLEEGQDFPVSVVVLEKVGALVSKEKGHLQGMVW